MCDFKPGDEVVYIGGGGNSGLRSSGVELNSVHIVKEIAVIGGYPSVWVDAHYWWICSSSFRKVQRRNLTEWLSQKTKFEEPKRIGENA